MGVIWDWVSACHYVSIYMVVGSEEGDIVKLADSSVRGVYDTGLLCEVGWVDCEAEGAGACGEEDDVTARRKDIWVTRLNGSGRRSMYVEIRWSRK
jgi:hypothetical protein